jgi:hypothetical protein
VPAPDHLPVEEPDVVARQQVRVADVGVGRASLRMPFATWSTLSGRVESRGSPPRSDTSSITTTQSSAPSSITTQYGSGWSIGKCEPLAYSWGSLNRFP